jgi:hypothetical protein
MTNESHDDELLRSLGRHTAERQKRDALRPLSADFQRRMANQIKRSVSATVESADDSPRGAGPARRLPWLALAASVLAAVGLSVTLVSRDPSVALPGYSLEFRGGAQVRSGSDAAPLQTGDQLDVVLRPDVATDQPLDLTVYRQQGDTLLPIDVNVRWSSDGAARVTALLDASLGIAPGTQHWLFVVANDGEGPSQRALVALQDEAHGDSWHAFRVSFELVP